MCCGFNSLYPYDLMELYRWMRKELEDKIMRCFRCLVMANARLEQLTKVDSRDVEARAI